MSNPYYGYGYGFPSYQYPQAQTVPQNNAPIWVQGEEAAKAYMVAPNQTVYLMDSERQTFYVKSADASGIPQSMRIFDFVERTSKQETPKGSEYVTKAEMKAYIEELFGKEEKHE